MSAEQQKKRGGSRKGAGRKARPKTPEAVDKGLAAEVLTLTETLDPAFKKALRPEVQAWHEMIWYRDSDKPLAQLTAAAQNNRRYLTDRRDGKAVQNVNHMHDKPLEMNVNLSLGERMREAMKKADERVASRKR